MFDSELKIKIYHDEKEYLDTIDIMSIIRNREEELFDIQDLMYLLNLKYERDHYGVLFKAMDETDFKRYLELRYYGDIDIQEYTTYHIKIRRS